MDDISQLIQTIIVILLGAGVVAFIVLCFFYKGVKKQITVIKKRQTGYEGMNNMRTRRTTETHFTVDCEINGKLRTYRTRSDIFSSLREGKSYFATIKLSKITKIHKS